MNVNKTQDGANLRFLCIETRGIAQKKTANWCQFVSSWTVKITNLGKLVLESKCRQNKR